MVHIEFKDLIINDISHSSGVFSGDNLQVKWKAVIKSNEGYGSLSGDSNESYNNRSIVIKTEMNFDEDNNA